ncbi:MAG TPA: hypothetical protein VLG50_07800 [Candidatus Saccharimonadales bacterium]|nr:hypothetical protein [Candidatus Saccharimonadales bacterium]
MIDQVTSYYGQVYKLIKKHHHHQKQQPCVIPNNNAIKINIFSPSQPKKTFCINDDDNNNDNKINVNIYSPSCAKKTYCINKIG